MLLYRTLKLVGVVAILLVTGCLQSRTSQDGDASSFKSGQVFENSPITKPRDRFDEMLSNIEGPINEAKSVEGVEARISSLTFSDVVLHLRRFQVLIYIYQKQYPELKKYYEEAKTLENLIGHQSDLDAFLSVAQRSGNAAAIEKATKNRQKGIDDLKAYIGNATWFAKNNDLISELKGKLDRIQWMSLEDDRNLVLSRIAKKMKKQHESTYDLNLPEDGMHELRRDVRRFSYLNEAASQLIRPDIFDKCSALTVAQYDQLSAEAKAKIIPNVVPMPVPKASKDYLCHVERCLTDKLDSISSSLVPLKYNGALQEARGEPVSPEYIRQANELYQNLVKSNVYLFLWSQLGSCQTKIVEDNDKDDKD